MSIHIRTLAADDRTAVEAVLNSDSTFSAADRAVALELLDDALDNENSDYWFRLAVVDDVVAGYICFGPTPMTKSTYDLYWIVSHADFRGRGVARGLVLAMECELLARHSDTPATVDEDARSERDASPVSIRVETSHTEGYGAARALYDRLNYPEIARFPNFYARGDDLIVFYKTL